MGKPTGFQEFDRREAPHRPIAERIGDFHEVDLPLPMEEMLRQAARCMDCGVPFCHGVGCPLANRIPEFNDLVYNNRWREACDVLHATNNFPEITGRICPALCEAACTLNLGGAPVLVKHIELQVAERGFEQGWIRPQSPLVRTGRRVAVVGSGPAGLAGAQQLARAGHDVVVFEKDHRPGGILRYGIPDFKLEKHILDRRLEQLTGEGVRFETGVTIGQDLSIRYIRSHFDAVCLVLGAGQPRELEVTGRDLAGVHLAMDFLRQQNRLNAGEGLTAGETRISAEGKAVVVVGGGDTGSDCAGTAIRQGARQVALIEILPKPPEGFNVETPWPQWPRILRTSSSHEEGCERRWSVLTKRLAGSDGRVTELHGIEVEWRNENGRFAMREVPGSEFVLPAELVLIAMGFVHVTHSPLVSALGLKLDARGNIATSDYHTSEPGIFTAGDAALGASLVVRAIQEGRQVAAAIDGWLRK
jgi:NAD(P)H-dependent glutamate synthase small subunit